MADGEVIRDVVLRLHLKQVQSTITPPDIGPAKKAAEEYASTAKKSADDASKASSAAANSIVEANLRAIDSYRLMAEGAIKLARGIAFLGIAEDENFKKALQMVAIAQGTLDIYRGLTDIVKGLTTALKAKAAAEAASTVTATASAAATTASAAATTGLAGGMTAVIALANPIGIAIAVAAGAYALWQYHISGVNKELDEQIAKIDKLDGITANYVSQVDQLNDRLDQQLRSAKPLTAQIDELTRAQNEALGQKATVPRPTLGRITDKGVSDLLEDQQVRSDRFARASRQATELLSDIERAFSERERKLQQRLSPGDQALLSQHDAGYSTNVSTQGVAQLEALRKEREEALRQQQAAMTELIELERRSTQETLRLRAELDRRKLEAGG